MTSYVIIIVNKRGHDSCNMPCAMCRIKNFENWWRIGTISQHLSGEQTNYYVSHKGHHWDLDMHKT
jgi:hypothetical protein